MRINSTVYTTTLHFITTIPYFIQKNIVNQKRSDELSKNFKNIVTKFKLIVD